MRRLIHAQTVTGGILVDDIDDGLPNKAVHRMGSTGDPKAYARDGYANSPKQRCYIPRVKPTNTSLPGYIDLEETDRVLHSVGNGKIAGLVSAGLITVVEFEASDLDTPAITMTALDAPGMGDITITGTDFLSVSPEITSVRLQGAGVGDVTLTKADIEAGGGSVTDTQIVIDTLLVPGLAAMDTVTVTADTKQSNTAVI